MRACCIPSAGLAALLLLDADVVESLLWNIGVYSLTSSCIPHMGGSRIRIDLGKSDRSFVLMTSLTIDKPNPIPVCIVEYLCSKTAYAQRPGSQIRHPQCRTLRQSPVLRLLLIDAT